MAATAGAAASAGSAFPLPFNSLPEVVEIMPSVSSPSSRWQHKMPACGAAGTDKSSLPLSDLIPFFPSASAASSEAAAAPGQQQHATGVLSCMAETPSCEAVTLATATAAEGSVSLSISKLSMAAPPSHPHPHPQQQQEQHMRSLLGQAATIPLDSSSETTHDEPFPWELRRTVSHAVRFVTARRATTTAADVSLQDPPDLPPPLQPPPQHQQPRMMQQQPSDGAAACSGPRGRPPVVQLGLMAALLLVASAGLLAVVQRAHMLPHPPPLPLLQLLQITQPSGTATAAARVLEEAGDTVTEAATDGGGNFDGRRGEVRLVGHHGGNVADAAKAVAAASSLSLATAAAEAPGQRVMRLLRETSRSVGGKTDGRRPSLPESSKTPALDEGRYQQQKQQNMNQLRLKHEKQKQERKRHTAGGITVLPSEDETALVDRSIVITPSSKGPVTPRSANGPLAYQVSIGGAHAAGEDCRAAWAAGRSTLKCGRHGKRGLDENGNDTSIGFIKGLNSNDSGADVTPHHGPAVSGAVMLQQCLNHRYEGLVAGWEDVGTVRPTVKVLGVWWSSHNTTLPLTVVTQLSANRLHQLRAMCRAYHGPLSAAVYVPIAIQGTGPDDSGGSDDDGKKRGRQHKASRRRKLGATESKGRRRPLSDAGGGDSDGSGAVMPGGDGGGVDRPYLSPLLTGPVASEGFRGLKSVVTAKSKMGIETGIRMGSGKGHHTATSSAATRTSHISGGGRHGHRDLSVAELTILRDTTDLVRAFWLEMERKKWCSLDLMLVYELYTDLRAMKTLYPVNHLRNWARLQARTPLIAMLDVDMLPSRDLLRDMRNKTTAKWYINACAPPGLPANWSVAKPSNGSSATAATAATAAAAATLRQRPLRELERDPQASTEGRATTGSSSRGSSGRSGSNGKIPTVFVLPAFQTANETSSAENIRIADRMANMTKAQLEVAVVLEAALPFHVRNFPAGHGATNYLHWFRTNEAYDITYARKFEPWFMAGRQVVPWHDARLRGYGLNKIIQVAATNATGALFNVHPAAFLIHRPHTRSTARGELNDDASDYRRLLRAVMRNVTGMLLRELQDAEIQEQQQLMSLFQQSSPKPALEAARRCNTQGLDVRPGKQQQLQQLHTGGRGLLTTDFHVLPDEGAEGGSVAERNASVNASVVTDSTPKPPGVLELAEYLSSDKIAVAQETKDSNTEASGSVDTLTLSLDGMTGLRPWLQRRKLQGQLQDPQQQQQQQPKQKQKQKQERKNQKKWTPPTTVHPPATTLSSEMKLIARTRAEAIIHDTYQHKMRYNIFWNNLHVYKDARFAMKTQSYVPVLDPSTEYCMGVLPWWNDSEEQYWHQQRKLQPA